MQNKPNLLDTQINATSVTIKNYEENRLPNPSKANPKQTQFNPIKANLTQLKPNFKKGQK